MVIFFSIQGILWQPTPNGPPQPRGVFSCRILNCAEKLPVCRMLNHVRTFHASNLTEVSDYYVQKFIINYILERFKFI